MSHVEFAAHFSDIAERMDPTSQLLRVRLFADADAVQHNHDCTFDHFLCFHVIHLIVDL
jgi:hypothetical protein